MSTRCTTEVRSKWKETNENWGTHVIICRHYDGHFKNHGEWLYDFLRDLQIVNGVGGKMPKHYVNGPGCLASLLVSELQSDGYEPELLSNSDTYDPAYRYQIDILFGDDGGTILLTVYDFNFEEDKCSNKIFTGTVQKFGVFLRSKENKKITLAEKIDKLNELCCNTLEMTSYLDGTGWSAISYGLGTPLGINTPTYEVNASSFEETIDKALKHIKNESND